MRYSFRAVGGLLVSSILACQTTAALIPSTAAINHTIAEHKHQSTAPSVVLGSSIALEKRQDRTREFSDDIHSPWYGNGKLNFLVSLFLLGA
jgi:hypothetical protein